MMDRLIGNARATAAVFMADDPRAARQLLGEKEVFREIELRTTEEYFGLHALTGQRTLKWAIAPPIGTSQADP